MPQNRSGAVCSARRTPSTMMPAINAARRRSPPSLYSRTIFAGTPSNTAAATQRAVHMASPRHSVHSSPPKGAPHCGQACTGSMRTMRARHASHSSAPGRSQHTQRVGESVSSNNSRALAANALYSPSFSLVRRLALPSSSALLAQILLNNKRPFPAHGKGPFRYRALYTHASKKRGGRRPPNAGRQTRIAIERRAARAARQLTRASRRVRLATSAPHAKRSRPTPYAAPPPFSRGASVPPS